MDELEQIRQKIDIVSLISEHLPLKKMGRNFRVNCPFHNEKTPSFTVSPERQIFHCFGCGEGGDIFTFLMKYENLEFPEALRILASRAGVQLQQKAFDSKTSQVKEKLYQINHLASEFYHYLLTSHPVGKKALEYLHQRAINDGSIKTYKLGFAPGVGNSLVKFLVEKKKYTMRDLSEAGLAVGGNDRFRDRVMFPLTDHRDNVVGFSGRVLGGEREAKYINTPETIIYHKGSLFYGLFLAREAVKKQNQALIVEGEFDVIQSRQQGLANTVAIKGTALTENQATLIHRFTDNVSLCLDKDKAGELANLRGIEILENANLQVNVVELPGGKDPDENLRDKPVLFKNAVKKPTPMYDFIISSAASRFGSQTAGGKKKIGEQVAPFLAKISNEIVKNHYIKKLSQLLEVSEEAVAREVLKSEKKETKFQPQVQTAPQVKKTREEVLAEYLLALILQSPVPQTFESYLEDSLFTSPLYQKIFAELKLFLAKIEQSQFLIKEFVGAVPEELVPAIDRSFLLTLPESLTPPAYLTEFTKTASELKQLVLKEKMRHLSFKIKQAEEKKDEQELVILRQTASRILNQSPIE